MNDKVRAAVLTGPGNIEIQEFPYPKCPEGGAIIKMELAGICGTDKHTYKGEVRQFAGTPAETSTPFPIIQGHENVGVIVEITEEGRHKLEYDGQILNVGDRVVMCPDVACGECWYCKHIADYPWCDTLLGYGNAFTCAEPPHLFGGFAEYMAIVPGVKLYKVPEGMPPELAVFAELFDVTYSLDKAKEHYTFGGEGFAFGDTVMIQGAGPLGIMLCEWGDIDMWRCYAFYTNAGRHYNPFVPKEVWDKNEGGVLDLMEGKSDVADEASVRAIFEQLSKYFPSWVGYNMAKCGGCIRACTSVLEKKGGCMEGRFDQPLRTGKAWKMDR